MGEYGTLAVFLLILAENLFPPIPSEVILTVGGVMTRYTKMSMAGVIFSATAGSVFGAILLYLAGYLIPETILETFLEGRPGRFLHFRKEDMEMARGWFQKKGNAAVFVCRMIPIVRSLISVPAGFSHMRMLPFLILTAAGSFLWNTALVFLGRAAGSSWEKVAEAVGIYSDVFLMVLATGILLGILVFHPGENR